MKRQSRTAVATALVAGMLQAAAAQSGPGIRLTDITAAAGLRFKHATGATGRKYLPETLGSGAAIFDARGGYDAAFAIMMASAVLASVLTVRLAR